VSGLIKRSVTIAGHRTSVSLEPVFWDALVAAADAEGRSVNAIVAEIDEARTTNLSSAIRVWLFERRSRACPDQFEAS
jgi:predicted DNA-binding ribbon-helix-helix protein